MMFARARTQVVSSQAVRRLTLALGVGAVAVGVVMVARGHWGAALTGVLAGAVMTWLAGAWVLPVSEDAYLMRVERSVRDGVGKLGGSYETFERYARRQRGRLDRLQPPTGLEKGHARLIELLDRADESAKDPSLSLKARAAEVTRSLEGAREQRATLIDEPADDASRRYAKALERVAQSSQDLMEGAFGRAEEAVEAIVDKLDGTTAPPRLAARHDTLVEASRRFLDAMRAYHDAVRELDPDAVATAAAECEAAKARINESVTALREDSDR